MEFQMRATLKYVLVILLSFPVAAFLVFDVYLCFSRRSIPILDLLAIPFLLVTWGGLIYWGTRVSSIKESVARTCRAFASAAFLLMATSIVFWAIAPRQEQPIIIPKEFFAIVLLVFGGIMGVLGLIASRVLSPKNVKVPKESSQ